MGPASAPRRWHPAALNLTAGIDHKREILEGTGLGARPARVAWSRAWIGFSGVSEVRVPA